MFARHADKFRWRTNLSPSHGYRSPSGTESRFAPARIHQPRQTPACRLEFPRPRRGTEPRLARTGNRAMGLQPFRISDCPRQSCCPGLRVDCISACPGYQLNFLVSICGHPAGVARSQLAARLWKTDRPEHIVGFHLEAALLPLWRAHPDDPVPPRHLRTCAREVGGVSRSLSDWDRGRSGLFQLFLYPGQPFATGGRVSSQSERQ